MVFQFHWNIAKVPHFLRIPVSVQLISVAKGLLTARLSMPPNYMEVPQVERKIYGSTEQKFLAGVKHKSEKIIIKVPFWNLLEMQECQIQPFVFAGAFSATVLTICLWDWGWFQVFSLFSCSLPSWLPEISPGTSEFAAAIPRRLLWHDNNIQAAATLLWSPARDSLGLLCGLGYLGLFGVFLNLFFSL